LKEKIPQRVDAIEAQTEQMTAIMKSFGEAKEGTS